MQFPPNYTCIWNESLTSSTQSCFPLLPPVPFKSIMVTVFWIESIKFYWFERANDQQQFYTINSGIYFWRYCRDYAKNEEVQIIVSSTVVALHTQNVRIKMCQISCLLFAAPVVCAWLKRTRCLFFGFFSPQWLISDPLLSSFTVTSLTTTVSFYQHVASKCCLIQIACHFLIQLCFYLF